MDFDETEVTSFTSFDGAKLDVHIWSPEKPSAVIMAVHGVLSHAGDYVTVGNYFKNKGIATVSYDLRGHKQKRIKLKSFNQYIEDTKSFREWVIEKFPNKPLILVAHSAGALICIKWLLDEDNPNLFNAYILSAPYFRNAVKVPKIMEIMSSVLAKVIPNAKVPAEDFVPNLTNDEEITKRIYNDVERGLRSTEPSIRFGNELLKAQKWVAKNFSDWNIRALFILAGHDKVADVSFTRELLKPVSDKLKILDYQDNYHENFNELNREDIFSEMEKWIQSNLT